MQEKIAKINNAEKQQKNSTLSTQFPALLAVFPPSHNFAHFVIANIFTNVFGCLPLPPPNPCCTYFTSFAFSPTSSCLAVFGC